MWGGGQPRAKGRGHPLEVGKYNRIDYPLDYLGENAALLTT